MPLWNKRPISLTRTDKLTLKKSELKCFFSFYEKGCIGMWSHSLCCQQWFTTIIKNQTNMSSKFNVTIQLSITSRCHVFWSKASHHGWQFWLIIANIHHFTVTPVHQWIIINIKWYYLCLCHFFNAGNCFLINIQN